ncbi:MAG: ornithine cyclodeaminase family protein [Spirochaetaceae bacterium]|nr:ornithine cyclodeaminase family protein [Spirochaetaceae bacterium]
MSVVRVLNRRQVSGLISMPMALDAVEEAYRMKGEQRGELWPMVVHVFGPDHRGDLDIKSGNLPDRYGLKVVSWFGANEKRGLPALTGTELLFDMENGQPVALLDAGPITDYRTGASAAVGAKYLAPIDSRRLCIVGCGALAPYVASAFALLFPGLEEMTIVNPLHPVHAVERLEHIKSLAERLAGRSIPLVASEDTESAVRTSDLVTTITPATQPVVKAAWLHKGMHLSCIGADMEGKQEIESDCARDALLFCDDCSQSLSVGEFEKPFREGILKKLDGEIGAVVAGRMQGRRSKDAITIFDASGIALLDLSMAKALVAAAEGLGVGSLVEW